jgi:hypothetical protein
MSGIKKRRAGIDYIYRSKHAESVYPAFYTSIPEAFAPHTRIPGSYFVVYLLYIDT